MMPSALEICVMKIVMNLPWTTFWTLLLTLLWQARVSELWRLNIKVAVLARGTPEDSVEVRI